ncbi:MAG: carnitine dehydratase, partial [Agromyces sp.]|nr:carnitine dehydratase [Agromyces sp.]
ILLALRERDRTGAGQLVEVNLLQSLLSALTNQASSTLATGTAPRRMGNQHPSIAPYAVFRAADRELVIAVGNEKQFRALADVLGAPELADDERFRGNADRVAHRVALHDAIEQALAGASAAHWVDALTRVGVPSGLVNDVAEAIAFADALGLEPVASAPDPQSPHGPHRSMSNPIGLSASPPDYRTAPPALGEHDGADWLPRA